METEESLIRVSVTFKVPHDVCLEAVRLAASISHIAPVRSLPSMELSSLPHITIYASTFPEKNLPTILDALRRIAESHSGVTFVPEGPGIKGRYVSVQFTNEPSIQNIHEEIVTALSPFREGHVNDTHKDSEVLGQMTEEEKMNVEKWGYPYVMGEYLPHLTMIALEDKKDAAIVAQEVRWDSSFVSFSIGVLVRKKGKEGNRTKESYDFSLNR